MAVYRNVSLNFWTDSKVDDEFSPEDKYFMLYLLTNPHTNLCGCYEISTKQMERETGYNVDSVRRIIDRLEKTHNVIRYSSETKEILILNWYKYNWGSSDKVKSGIKESAKEIKNKIFKAYVLAKCDDADANVDEITNIAVDDVAEALDEVEEKESAEESINKSEPVVIELILNDKSKRKVTQSEVDRWSELYPNVDVMQQLRNMAGWCESNQQKRKTRRGIDKFINSWLSREQDKCRRNPTNLYRSNIVMPVPKWDTPEGKKVAEKENKLVDTELIKKIKEMQKAELEKRVA